MLRNGSFCILFITWHISHSVIFRNFSCITYNWDINLTCNWSEPTDYGSDLTTHVTWIFEGQIQEQLKCPISTRASCSWGLGGGDGSFDVDPDRRISVCLQLTTTDDVPMSVKECHSIDIADKVKPAVVSYVHARATPPLCLNISWNHENNIDPKKYELKLLSEREEIVTDVGSKTDKWPEYHHDEESYHVCNLSYNTQYTISVRTRPLNFDGVPTGYWSNPTTMDVVTRKSVPSRSPSLLPGAFTLSPTNFKGYRSVTVYWSALPRDSWNSDNLTYVIKASTAEPCSQQTLNLLHLEASSQFEILSNCSYNISLWARNEIGLAYQPSKMYIGNKGPKHPEDVFINAAENSELVEISWKHYAEANLITIYWCQSNPARSCTNDFNHKIVSTTQDSTCVSLKGSPVLTYIFGVSAEIIRNGRTVSSGFYWTDCSTILPRTLKSPRIHFRGFPKERKVSVSWIYPYCNALIIRKLEDSAEYQIIIHTSSEQYNRTLPGNTNSVLLHNIHPGEKVCVTVAARLNEMPEHVSPVKCYIQGEQGGSDFPSTIVISVLCSVIGLCVVIGSVCLTRTICRWWRRQVPVSLPELRGATEMLMQVSIHCINSLIRDKTMK
ncbi:uncharacterized protein LOC117325351 isoform X2 [Pecten maximus]|uniref:uncharacterized protein LOC117325351 isoform X2 n=1 Tax=Pecten maximus TaxID=6579 RepID=UPI001458EC7B|nr:uncharacterized protein LOC117325351 isoform X2 [Pecten maximus]